MNISNNVSSIQAHQTMLNINANNVANINTDGFRPSDTKMSDEGNAVSANLRLADDNGSTKSQTDLAKELPDQIIAQDAVAVNVEAIRTKDEMLGTLLDMKA
ncbi:MAG: flagellar basal body protein [Campylobacterota bacterium]|nr:flagellar basal body protein [Campylobacterota bacterium]